MQMIKNTTQNKRHVQFLTSAPNFMGKGKESADPAFQSPCVVVQVTK